MSADPLADLRHLFTLDRPGHPWFGTTIMFHHSPGGGVEASSRGVAAVGRDETEALCRLGELLDGGETADPDSGDGNWFYTQPPTARAAGSPETVTLLTEV